MTEDYGDLAKDSTLTKCLDVDFALKAARLGVWELDPLTNTINWDDRCRELFGLANDNRLPYEQAMRHVHPEDVERVNEAARRAMTPESGGHYDITYRTIGADDGRLRWVRFTGQGYFTETGAVYRFAGVAQDVTKDMQAQQLAISQDVFRSIIGQIPAATMVLRGDAYVIEQVNEPMNALIGYGSELIGKPLLTVMPELEQQPVWQHVQQVYREGIPFNGPDVLVNHVRAGVRGDHYYNLAYRPLTEEGRVTGVIQVVTDVTEQVTARQKLQENDRYFRHLTDTVPAIIWETDATGYCTYLNRQWYDITGQTNEEAEGFGWLNATHPDDMDAAGRLFMEANETKTPFNAVYRLRQRDGSYRWSLDKANPRFSADGTYEGMIGTVVDLHEQALARQQLAVSEAKFRALIEEAPVATCLFVGRELRIDIANEAMIAVWGKGPSVIGQPLAKALPELEGQHFLATLDRLFTTGETYDTKAGRADLVVNGVLGTYYFDYTFKPLRNATGAVYAILEMAIDVTEQVLARQKLEQAEASLRGAVDLAGLATWNLDISRGTYSYSDRFMDWLGFSEQTKSIDDAYDPVPDAYRQAVADAIAAVIQPGSSGFYENEHPIVNRRTGQVRLIHAQAQVFPDALGQPAVLRGTALDVTEQRRVQQELERQVQLRTQELQASVQDLSRSNENLQQFAYVASHDLQEPLRKIQSFGDMLALQYGSQLGEGIDYLRRMQSAAGRMSTLIKDLLTYSRISTRQEATEPVVLDDVVRAVLTDLDLAISEAGATVTVDTLPTVFGDASQLGQLFQNLLSNALKFRQPGTPPVMRISARSVAATNLPPTVKPTRAVDTYYRLDVTDNGIGFEQQHADRIFQVFQRLHGKNEFAGTGIGLAICEKVAANHGGAIAATSQPGRGATFSVYLPVSS